MLHFLQNQLQLSGNVLLLMAGVVLLAGMVRGFAGFGLSALVMASLAVFIPPLALIPVSFIFEAVSSLVMFRGGLREGNRPLLLGLITGYALGLPVGLAATHTLAPEISRALALGLILCLAALQLLRVSPRFLAARWGSYVAGFLAGAATGLAAAGGMVVALFVLALHMPAREIRGSLVLFLFASMAITGFWLSITGTLDPLAIKRGLTFAPLVIAGVLTGTWLFRPSLEPYYKRFCLWLLIVVASVGLMRLM